MNTPDSKRIPACPIPQTNKLFHPIATPAFEQRWQINLSQVPSAPPSQPHHPSTNPSRRKTSSAYKTISNPRATQPHQLHSQPQRRFPTSSPSHPRSVTSYHQLHPQMANTAPSAPFTKSPQHRPRKNNKHRHPRGSCPSRINSSSPSSP